MAHERIRRRAIHVPKSTRQSPCSLAGSFCHVSGYVCLSAWQHNSVWIIQQGDIPAEELCGTSTLCESLPADYIHDMSHRLAVSSRRRRLGRMATCFFLEIFTYRLRGGIVVALFFGGFPGRSSNMKIVDTGEVAEKEACARNTCGHGCDALFCWPLTIVGLRYHNSFDSYASDRRVKSDRARDILRMSG